ncbi:MAG TPA: type VI secretion system contractile sheath large subunit, partial [Marinobacter sp.]|nr:type VI secretion system contractile sheath large subunit [Marinobacter sp.]
MSDTAEQQSAATESVEEGSLLDQVMANSRMAPADEGYDVARRGVATFISNLLKSDEKGQPVNKALVDQMVVELDRKISAQMDEILHAPGLQALESSWRGLKLMVDRTDFQENIKVDILHATKEELLEDFEFAPDVTQSGFYKHIYSNEYGQFGGEPVGAIVGNYAFTPATPDMKLLQYVSSVGAMSHAPFLSSVAPQFFGVDSYQELPAVKELKAVFEGPKYAKWRSLRESEDARYLGLTSPRFLLRTPYDPTENPVRSFSYKEDVSGDHEHYLWGNTAYLLATRLTESFARYRWCPNIIGPQSGGSVEDLPVHTFESFGQLEAKIPTEVLITDRREYELAEEGFIALT